MTHPFTDRWNHNSELYPTVADLVAPHTTVLDVGCGEGTLVRHLRALGHNALGVDCDQAALPAGDPSCKLADATNLPFGHESFDAVVSVAMLHHLADPTLALAEMRRVVTASGIIVIVGLAIDRRPADWARSAKDAVTSRVRARGTTPWEPDVPVREPHMGWDETRTAIEAVLEGATFERVGSWRYLATWSRSN